MMMMSSAFIIGSRSNCRQDNERSSNWQAKDVVKAVKRRLQHKSSKVQLLALTIAERDVLGEMVKIEDMLVRDKILTLLDSWQEAFGDSGGKHPQYYWAYDELRRSGVEFPKRSSNKAPIYTPPATHPNMNPGYGIQAILLELLSDMLKAVNPSDSAAVKDEVVVDLVNQCRSNQRKMTQMLTTTGDEELLAQGLELNDGLQSLLAKHDAIAVGPVDTVARSHIDEEEDDFAQLARRHSRAQFPPSQSTFAGTSGAIVPINNATAATSSVPTALTSIPSNALALPDLPAPIRTSKEQDLIDLLSLTLSTTLASTPHTPPTPSVSHQNLHQGTVTPNCQGHPYASQTYPGSQGPMAYSSYVVPWAQPQAPPQRPSQPQNPKLKNQSNSPAQTQTQFKTETRPQFQPQSPSQSRSLHQAHQQTHHQLQTQSQIQNHSYRQPQYQQNFQPQYGYPPPPWAATPGYFSGQNHHSSANMFSTPGANTVASNTPTATRPLQHNSSLHARGTNGGAPMNGDSWTRTGPRNTAPATGQKPFIPSYRLFEDLNVLGNADGRHKMTNSSNTSSSPSGTNTQSMVG
ncbi:Detected protein of unknown function [Hibiscus syriacus]|uniref:Uncharacterized protein n=1 Tax=Hibiscus syriacus TaxID=106335 RepID=A0A6A3BC16_HIBSY|nr:Detected protein of unknown function [Hibiscus syriacus]